MSTVNALLNLSGNDYQASFFNRRKDRTEELQQLAEEQQQEKLDTDRQQIFQEAQEITSDVYKIGQEIQQLSWAQAQKLLEAASLRIAASGFNQLTQMQSPGLKGIMPSAYI